MIFFTKPLYIKVYTNRFVIKAFGNPDAEIEGIPDKSFTTERLLVGNFQEAEKTLSQCIKKSLGSGLIKKRPLVVIHPKEKTEGGLSEVELKVFKELALGSGAAKVFVHIGGELTKDQVLDKLKSV